MQKIFSNRQLPVSPYGKIATAATITFCLFKLEKKLKNFDLFMKGKHKYFSKNILEQHKCYKHQIILN